MELQELPVYVLDVVPAVMSESRSLARAKEIKNTLSAHIMAVNSFGTYLHNLRSLLTCNFDAFIPCSKLGNPCR